MPKAFVQLTAAGLGTLLLVPVAWAQTNWRDQAREIRAMGQWRKAWYPQAPAYPVALAPGGDPDSLAGVPA
jgi:hypothetical protein